MYCENLKEILHMHEKYHFSKANKEELIKKLGKKRLIDLIRKLLLSRNFDIYAEAAYQKGKIGGFFHSSIGQEAISLAAAEAIGLNNWYTATYRCHAIYLMLNGDPNALMAELYGKATGVSKGRGGSMHLFLDNLLGGFGVVGGQIPVATGAAFSCKYKKEDKISVCFLGDGAVAQGAFHESLNLASLWNLPCMYIIENNNWGMGTNVKDAICSIPIAEKFAPSFNMKGYSVDGMDFFSLYSLFSKVYKEIKETKRPVLIEAVTSRFRGHSISDPGLYRTKEELEKEMKRDPIILLKKVLLEKKILTEKKFHELANEQKEIVNKAIDFAEKSPWPDPIIQEDEVLLQDPIE